MAAIADMALLESFQDLPSASLQAIVLVFVLVYFLHELVIYPFYTSPLANVPGPKLYAITKWRMVWTDFTKQRTKTIHEMHQKYGNVVRIGPDDLHFSGDEPMRIIYGAGTVFSKPAFYNLFSAYGVRPMFAMIGNRDHGERRKTISNTYAKSYILSPSVERLLQDKVTDFMNRVHGTIDVVTEFHLLGLDIITAHVYGPVGTKALKRKDGNETLLNDFIGPKSTFMWSLVHFPDISEMVCAPGVLNTIAKQLRIVRKTSLPYSTMRQFCYDNTIRYLKECVGSENTSVMSKMLKYHVSQGGDWSDAELAAEAGDHSIAGSDTTSETLTYLVWQISRPEYQHIQSKLQKELNTITFTNGVAKLRAVDKLPYLNSIINEALRVYPAIPMSEPRVILEPGKEVSIYGVRIPPGTICSMQPYTENRIPEVFPDPDKFDPNRWMISKDSEHYRAMNRMMWSFSSGGRGCIGLQYVLLPGKCLT